MCASVIEEVDREETEDEEEKKNPTDRQIKHCKLHRLPISKTRSKSNSLC